MSSHIEVDQKTLDIYQLVWDYRIELIKWNLFQKMMVGAGFAVFGSGGSAVSFKRGKQTAVIHKPHEPKGNQIYTRFLRDQLRKHLDWDADTFVLEDE
ncbi:hypothetical protein OBBRIDRAFT_839170 [Obba rivulosa]|uniref:Uncharacterized protein n=1 Tax=Obba rivulosa TaxID=1052685 RepID=A0A8E2DFQ0_9APHY|nr:hypothetical protein OBBRIDRAFT_839170 [Obba rivulosa]